MLAADVVLVMAAMVLAPAHDPLALEWQAPRECPDAEELRHRIEARATVGTERSAVTAKGTITRTDDGYTLALEVATAAGASTLAVSDPSCEVLTDGSAMKIAMTLNDATVEVEESPVPATEPPAPLASPPQCPPSRPCDPIVAPAPLRPPTRWIALRTATGLDWGTLPGLGPQLEVGVALVRWPRVRIEATGIYWHAREFWSVEDPARGGTLHAGGVLASACGVLGRPGALEVPLCGGLELAVVGARARTGTPRDIQRIFRSAAVLSPALVWLVGNRIGLSLAPAIAIPFTRYAFADGPARYRARSVAVRLALGLEVRIGTVQDGGRRR
jgi:hypothetical protein